VDRSRNQLRPKKDWFFAKGDSRADWGSGLIKKDKEPSSQITLFITFGTSKQQKNGFT
jgi:hypothetical protein